MGWAKRNAYDIPERWPEFTHGCRIALLCFICAITTNSIAAEPPSAVTIYRLLVESERPLASGSENPFRLLLPEALVAAERFVASPISSQLLLTTYDSSGFPTKYDYFLLMDGKIKKAKLDAADPWMNLAVLKIEEPLPSPHFIIQSSGRLKIDEVVKQATLDRKLGQIKRGALKVSAQHLKQPSIKTSSPIVTQSLHDFGDLVGVESDPVLHPGAPLLNPRGELAAIATGSASGRRSLCIAIDVACANAIEALVRNSPLEYGFLGLEPGNVQDLPNGQGFHGVYARTVTQHTPARLAGIREENAVTGERDVIAEVNGDPVESSDQFLVAIGRLPFESIVKLSIRRRKPGAEVQPIPIEVKLAKRFTNPQRPYYSQVPQYQWRGLTVDYYTAIDEFAARSRLVDPQGCVVIVTVANDSVAWKAGLRPGQFLTQVGDTRVKDVREFIEATAKRSAPVKVTTTARPDAIRLEAQTYELAP